MQTAIHADFGKSWWKDVTLDSTRQELTNDTIKLFMILSHHIETRFSCFDEKSYIDMENCNLKKSRGALE